jgi:hypothetical protein
MTFQYARRRKHVVGSINPFKDDYTLKDGVYRPPPDWNRFKYSDQTVYRIFKIYPSGRYDCECIERGPGTVTSVQVGEVFHGLGLGHMRHESTGKRVTTEELLAFKDLL